jgi:hypothetical protein
MSVVIHFFLFIFLYSPRRQKLFVFNEARRFFYIFFRFLILFSLRVSNTLTRTAAGDFRLESNVQVIALKEKFIGKKHFFIRLCVLSESGPAVISQKPHT